MLNLKTLINFLLPRARKDDPQTSKDAGEQSHEFSYGHQEIIFGALIQYGPMGKDGIAVVTGLEKNSVARRLKELQKMGMIELTGLNVKSDSGRNERQWKTTGIENA